MRTAVLALAFLVAAPLAAAQEERVPGEHWMRYVDPAEAGFDAQELAAARATWEGLPSSAFLVIADGAVVAGWGDLERRFMCHSVRKSFLSALYGIYWDRGRLELDKTLADLGLDDEPEPLLESEKRARIVDLLQARSGVFHPAAYAGRTDSRPRGSEGPGRFFAYNNWDFNTLAAILMQEVDVDLFQAFDEHFGRPLGMQDWRVSDGYYHHERDKSKYPAYPFRMSARDAARFGLLFARQGAWGEQSILSRHWVRRSTAMCSIDTEVMGYAYMWWVFREPRFERHGMVAALGVGNQMIAALPDSDLVIVNRANTYADEDTPMAPLLDLIEAILAARKGEPVAEPRLVPLEERAPVASTSAAGYEGLVGRWPVPPAVFGWPAEATIEVVLAGGRLVWTMPGWGTFALDPQPDGTLLEEDSLERYYPVRDAAGAFAGIATAAQVADGAVAAAARGERERAEELLLVLPEAEAGRVALAKALFHVYEGDFEAAAEATRALSNGPSEGRTESTVNALGYGFLRADLPGSALPLFELNTLVFPRSSNAWDSLAEAHMTLGHHAEAREFYQASLELNANNANARARLAQLDEAAVTTGQ
jgi:CubicO group peptidase (beta-lactamase class C family)